LLEPEALLIVCKTIEKELGRKKSFRWGPREIDLDILFYGMRAYSGKKLVIPHADLHNRYFVLVPLVEIAPGLVHPLLHKRVSALLANLIRKDI
jgi:2-amino-4-hydroxy-6-hydroxymethyldihydropteridine diphosphokinase